MNYVYEFQMAAFGGHLPVMERLMVLAPDNVQDMVRADNFGAFREAARGGHLPVMERLTVLAPDNVQDMVRADNFYAFRNAAYGGHFDIMERLMVLTPDNVQDMVRADDFGAFGWAAHGGHLPIMERLMVLAPNNVQDMVRADDFGAFGWAASRGHLPVMERLIAFSSVFAYAEMHVDEYSHPVQAFIANLLVNLRQEINAFNTTNPNDVFDIVDHERASLYFYTMRNLMRQNTPESLEQLNLLLSIPSVKALAHQAVTPNQPNELLRLAMSLRNQEAAAILLNIPAVRDLAVAADFYRLEQRNGLDLRAVAADRESSMHTLTQGEQKRLEDANQKYQPEIKRQGISHIISELKNLLSTRYTTNPATVETKDGKLIELPLEFRDFQALANSLSVTIKEQALKRYYRHPDHSAYRYLSKPNLWMSNDAHFVYRNNEGSWSTFEAYQLFISLLYLAAKDEQTPAINGHTIGSRLTHFIQELALIGRAHNWDATRINPATGDSEEYDDLGGDNPSCSSGVKRRLFQSVQGHPLLTLLTSDIIHQEVRNIVRNHFIRRITDENCETLHDAWRAIIEGETPDSSILDALNFSAEEQAQHIASISLKYGSQLDETLTAHLRSTFEVTPPFRHLAGKFGGEIDLMGIIENKKLQNCSEQVSNATCGSCF